MPRVLIVEDDEALRWCLETWMRSWAWAFDTASDGAAMIERCARGAYDAILLDAKLPDWDGLQLAQDLCSKGALRGARVVLMSGRYYGGDPAVTDAFAKGHIQAFVSKPFTHQALREAMDGGALSGAGHRRD